MRPPCRSVCIVRQRTGSNAAGQTRVICAAMGLAGTADRRPIQQVAEMSAPRTCSDRVRGCPAVAEILVSARGVDAVVPAL